jgi:Kef-type K+ transport system membrane component KefB
MAATAAHFDLAAFLFRVAILICAAVLLGWCARAVGMPALAGELLAGVLIGPTVLGAVWPETQTLLGVGTQQFSAIEALGHVGVLLLLGLTGSATDLAMIRRHAHTATRISLYGLVIPFALGAGVGYSMHGLLSPTDTTPLVTALFLGTALSVTAIPVIAKTLIDLRLAHRDVGQLITAAGMVDDALAWMLLSMVAALATSAAVGSDIVLAACKVLLVIPAALLLRIALRPILRLAGRIGDQATTATTVVAVLAAAGATQAVGLEAILGAFACGLVISSLPEFRVASLMHLRAVVAGVLAPLFFALAGLKIDLGALARPAVLGLAAVVIAVAIIGKASGAYLGSRLSKLGPWPSLAIAAGMNSRGVVEIVVATVGLNLGVLTQDSYTVIVLMALVTSLMAPPLLRLAANHIDEQPWESARLRNLNGAAPQLPEKAPS